MKTLKRLFADKFIKNNIVFFCGSMIVAFLNYLYYPVLGRTMELAAFGELQAFLSLVMIFGVFAGIFRNVIVNVVSNVRDEAGLGVAAAIKKTGFRLSLAVALAVIVFAGPLASFLNLKETYLYPALAAIIVLSVSSLIEQGVIQGLRDFKALSASGIIYSACRIVFSFGLVWFGLGLLGAVGGIVLAQAIAFVYAYLLVRKKIDWSRGRKPESRAVLDRELRYAFLVFAASLATTFMYSGDTIVIKKFFSPETAGLYGGIATVGRIVFFVTASVAAVLFPSIKAKDEDGGNRKILLKAVLLTAGAGGTVLLIFSLFPSTIVDVLIGRRYGEYVYLLPLVSLFLFLISFANLFFYYLLALRDRFVLWAAAVGPVATIGLCFVNHGTVKAVVVDFVVGSAIVLALLVSRLSVDLKRKLPYEPVNIGSDTLVQ